MIDLRPDLKNTEIVEVYVYYDRPLLFLCQDLIGRKYIAVLVDEDDEGEYWLYVEISQRRLEMIRSGGIDLHTAFGHPESGYAFSLRLEFSSENITIKPLAAAEISQEWLPKKETKLEIPTETLPRFVFTPGDVQRGRMGKQPKEKGRSPFGALRRRRD